jgi:hypothetical protein
MPGNYRQLRITVILGSWCTRELLVYLCSVVKLEGKQKGAGQFHTVFRGHRLAEVGIALKRGLLCQTEPELA